MLKLAISTDAKGNSFNATLIASILRRTQSSVHVRCWCRGFAPESFIQGRLRVDFIATNENVTGKFPSYVSPAVFDRLRVIRDAPDWDKCLIMDYDQLALCDLDPLFELDLGGHLLAAKMQGPGVDMAYAMRTWLKRPLPKGWEHVADYPYFSMGPLLNLAAMREAGTWEKLLAAHAAFGADEQLSLTAATEGRTMGFDRKWNLFPNSDIRDGKVPEGVIHWTGWSKPWHPKTKVWRPDLWEAEKTSWEALRMGLWDKLEALEIEPGSLSRVHALAKRGWKVKVVSSQLPVPSKNCECHENHDELSEPLVEDCPPMPDVERLLLDENLALRFAFDENHAECDMVRFGTGVCAASHLEAVFSDRLPPYVVLNGPVSTHEIWRLGNLGYRAEARIHSTQWPDGGPSPKVLQYHTSHAPVALLAGEELYLKKQHATGAWDELAETADVPDAAMR